MHSEYLHKTLDMRRAEKLKDCKSNGAVLYLMNRDQRTTDNHALSFAQALAIEQKQEFHVLFILDVDSKKYNDRQLPFMLQGLQAAAENLKHFKIPMILLEGNTEREAKSFFSNNSIGSLVLDFSPLRKDNEFKKHALDNLNLNIYEVDAHNIVPCRVVSTKQEFAAYTIRPKINKLLNQYSEKAIPLTIHKYNKSDYQNINWERLYKKYENNSLRNTFEPGEEAALRQTERFIEYKLEKYSDFRNDPTKEMQSDLSPYLHFGQVSASTVLERIQMTQVHETSKEQFVDELVVRKELSDNFCYYNKQYDSFDAFPDWAKKSLNLHRGDKRPYTYSLEQFEKSETDDPLWNAAQNQLILSGKMHGYMRMYWAKKILEWTISPEQALDFAIYLNDKYQLDGNDPNGYAGIAWSIGGLHDRAWFEREIYGKVRYMNANGCKRKFDTEKYINQYDNLKKLKQNETL